jgi:hypothetical protein
MTRVIVDQATRLRLKNLAELLEVCDEGGHVLGYFAPISPQNRSHYEGAEVPFSDAEVQDLLKQPRGRPLADILADLEKRA